MDTRPTMDQVKEGIFSAIQFEVEGRRALDLFAGSGQLGIEALSRGACEAVFVDARRDACQVVRENLSKLNPAKKKEEQQAPVEIPIAAAAKISAPAAKAQIDIVVDDE